MTTDTAPDYLFADALLSALARALDLVPADDAAEPEKPPPPAPEAPRRRRPPSRLYPKPEALVLPPGVIWNDNSGRPAVRVSIRQRMRYVCNVPATQAGADLAGEIVRRSRAMRDEGYGIEAIQAMAREELSNAKL